MPGFTDINAGNAKIFQIEIDDKVAGVDYKGVFSMRYPSVRDSIAIGIEASKQRMGIPIENLDVMVENLTRGLATLKVLCTSAPDWAKKDSLFVFDNLPDEVVLSVYYKYIDSKNFLYQGNVSSAAGDSERPGSTDTGDGGPNSEGQSV